ncbi:hypothetical protein EU537_07335 [Candidatus Thorarchaeota archaeon]|nr:MAG: hypothetical protein EU537_07335 [Candidatus Thorarchaeota archaeon]
MFASSMQRKGMTLIGLLLANAIFTGFFFYIDSYSLSVWDYETHVGPATMVITGSEVIHHIEGIRALPTVTRASYLRVSTAQIVPYKTENTTASFHVDSISDGSHLPEALAPVPEELLNMTVRAVCLDEKFVDLFPTINNITAGHLPTGPAEIALSTWVANRFGVGPGDIIVYEHGTNSYYTQLDLVGVYAHEETDTRNPNYYTVADVIVPANLMTEEGREAYSFVDTDRGGFSPFYSDVAISSLSTIEESIRELDPQYSPEKHSFFYIDDILAKGILRYNAWIDSTKTTQLIKAQSFYLFGIIWLGISVRFNLKKRKTIDDWFSARGASSRQITTYRLGELVLLASISVLLSIPIGFLTSRFGFTMDYPQSSYVLQYSSHFFISLDSIVSLMLLGILGPVVMLATFLGVQKARTVAISGSSRLERISSALRLLRWDIVVVSVSLITLVGLWEIGNSIAGTPLLLILLYGAPLALILGCTSLLTKGIGALSRILSRVSNRPAMELGLRRTGRDTTSAGATVLIVTLALSLTWNVAVIDATIPHTNLGHARFAIGADVTLRLDEDTKSLYYSDLIQNISSKPQVEALTRVTVYGFSLSSELQDTVEFVVVDPLEYARVGFDSRGIPIEDSQLMNPLQELEKTTKGAVVTSDIASRLDLIIGDALRAFRQNGTFVETVTFNVVGMVDSVPDSMIGPNGYSPPVPNSDSVSVGKERIWITREYASDILNIEDASMDLICIRLKPNSDGQAFLNEVIESGAHEALNGYAAASSIVRETTQTEQLVIARSLSSFLLVFVIASIPLSYVLYSVDMLEEDTEQGALLRAMGVETSLVKQSMMIEMIGIFVHSLLLLTVFAPIQTNNSMNITIISSNMGLRAFPVAVIPAMPMIPLVILFALTIVCALSVGIVSSMSIVKEDLAMIVHNTWAENLQFRREQ